MLSVARMYFERNRKRNRHALHDVGLATQNLVLQATSLGLYAHQMAGFDVEKARGLFAIPKGHEPVTVIAIGYLGDPETLPDPLRERELAPRPRKPLDAFVFTDRWEARAELVQLERSPQ